MKNFLPPPLQYLLSFLHEQLQHAGKVRQYVQWCLENCTQTKVLFIFVIIIIMFIFYPDQCIIFFLNIFSVRF